MLGWSQGREHPLGNNSCTAHGRSLEQELHCDLPCVGQGMHGSGGEDAVTSCGGSVCVHGRGEERGTITWSPEGVHTLVGCEVEAN